MKTLPFNPIDGQNRTIACTTTDATTVFAGNVSGAEQPVYRCVNAGAVVVFVRIARSTDTTAASAADTPVLPGSAINIFAGFVGEATTVHAVAASGTSTLYVQPGNGGV